MINKPLPALNVAKNKPFPRRCGFDSFDCLNWTARAINYDRNDQEVNAFNLAKIMDNTTHLGDTAQQFILENVLTYLDLLEDYDPPYNASSEYKYTNCYKQLYALMIYNMHLGLEYNLPKVLSRQLITTKEMLLEYFNAGSVAFMSSAYGFGSK